MDYWVGDDGEVRTEAGSMDECEIVFALNSKATEIAKLRAELVSAERQPIAHLPHPRCPARESGRTVDCLCADLYHDEPVNDAARNRK